MSQTIESMQRKIKVAEDLQKIVRTMKAMAVSSLEQYGKSEQSTSEYYRTVELGLGACLRKITSESTSIYPLISQYKKSSGNIRVVIFGSDQGLVGQFNNDVVEHAIENLRTLNGNHLIWTIGERVQKKLEKSGINLKGTFPLPKTVKAIGPLVREILIQSYSYDFEDVCDELYLIYNHRTSTTGYVSKSLRLLPLDKNWHRERTEFFWPTKKLPEVLTVNDSTLRAFIREYLFVSIFRTCTKSLTCESVSRLLAMQRADKKIEELLEELNRTFFRLRQGNIDEELFDVISGFEAL